ncbi:MAG: response regulator [Fimbriimonadaceae bacterium]
MIDKKIILLVEDDVADERLTLRALRKNNIMNEVVVACDGQEALDFLFREGAYAGIGDAHLPALVILDLKLPKRSGLDVLRAIRGDVRTAGVPVVILTANEDPSIVQECYRIGANSFVRKPTNAAEFSDAVLQVAMYWLLVNRVPHAAAI